MSRAGFEPATLCVKVPSRTMKKRRTDAGSRDFDGFIALRHFGHLRPIAVTFDHELTPVLTPGGAVVHTLALTSDHGALKVALQIK